MKRFHIALAVKNLEDSIQDYTQKLNQKPTVVVPEKYAMWRTDLLNFSINQSSQSSALRHIGFEDDEAIGFSVQKDINGIEWELFSREEQDKKIKEIYGESINVP